MSACLRLLAATIALLLPAAAVSAPVSAPSTGKATVLKSLSVLKQADLDFGELVVSGAGTAAIDPVSGTMATTGLVTPIGSTAHPAMFTATGSRNSVVIIHVPSSPVTLTRVGGGGTMTISDWTLDGKINRRMPPESAFNFSVGGTLNVGAAQAEGTYTGTFAVTVQYP